jgi:hypothetical protein
MIALVVDEGTGLGLEASSAPEPGPQRTRGRSALTAGLVLGAVAVLATVPACSSSPNPSAVPTTSSTTSTTSSVTLPAQSAAEIAACQADAKTVELALQTYQADQGAYPSPPSPWSAATYAANYQPLTSAADGGPYLPGPPHTTSYVIAYDSAGHVWVTPPGSYGAYDKGQDFDADPDVCDAAVG